MNEVEPLLASDALSEEHDDSICEIVDTVEMVSSLSYLIVLFLPPLFSVQSYIHFLVDADNKS